MAYETFDIKTGELNKYKGDTANTGIASSSVITPADLTPEPAINIPPPATDNTNYQNIINEGQTGATAANAAMTAANTPAPVNETDNLLANYLKDSEAPESQADIYAGLYGTTPEQLQAGVATQETDVAAQTKIYKQAQDEFNLLNAEMEALNLEAKAAPEQVQQESEGRGRTKFATNVLTSAKLRNIALRSLPLQGQMYASQAKVANAQGNVALAQNLLDKAQSKLDKVFALKLSDAENKYNYQQNLRKEVFGLKYEKATAEEKRKLDIIDRDEARKYEENQNKLNNSKAIIDQATKAGQFDIAAKIAQLDETSPTYDQDLLNLQSKITPEGYRVINPADIELVKSRGEDVIVRGGRAYAKAGTGTSPEVEAYVNQIRAGKIKLTSVPTALRGAVAVALGGDMGGGGGGGVSKKSSPTSTPTSNEEINDFDYGRAIIDANPDEKNELLTGFTPDEMDFQKKITAEINKLAEGGKWGGSWDYIKNLYPDIPNEDF